jgi:hypothetical protein
VRGGKNEAFHDLTRQSAADLVLDDATTGGNRRQEFLDEA